MKTISLRQPWAYLICSGIKDIENRTWKLPEKYKGQRVLIHASADRKLNLMALTREQYNDACDKFEWNGAMKPVDQWPRSAIIGAVKFSDCVINHPSIWAEPSNEVYKDPQIYGDNKIDSAVWNWVLANPILFDKPILNVKGKLGFWDYDLPEEYETILKI